jgi:hypothetical protein
MPSQASNDTGTFFIVCVVVDKEQAILYKENGDTIALLQGDPRLADIVAKAEAGLNNPGDKVQISLARPDDSTYLEYEKKSSGFVRFFKVAKSALAKILIPELSVAVTKTYGEQPPVPGSFITKEEIDNLTIPPSPMETLVGIAKDTALPLSTRKSAVAEIMEHAQTKHVSHPEFTESDIGDDADHTMVAVVGDKVVAGMEMLKPQLAHSVSLGSTKGMDAFMTRIATVIDKRRHSVEDLLKFLKVGDLPIADDGSIIIYKVLNHKVGSPGYYTDVHTGKVLQRVGSFVCMNEDMVNPDRRQACSNGLHVATRRYIGGFNGTVITLGKVAPEDVIAVPNHDNTKMRVSGYHILFELNAAAQSQLRSNRPFTDTDEAQLLLGRALAGDHDPILEEVRITGSHGAGVVITARPQAHGPSLVKQLTKEATLPVVPKRKSKVLVEAGEAILAPAVDPKAIAKRVATAKDQAESRSQKAKRLYEAFQGTKSKKSKIEAAQALIDYKKTVKLGWDSLGLDNEIANILKKAISS